VQRRLDGGLRCAPAEAPAAQAGGNDFGIVDHKRVTRAQQVGQIAHAPVIDLRGRAWTHDQKPRCIPRRNGTQGNPVGGQFKIEQGGAHGPSYKRPPGRSSPGPSRTTEPAPGFVRPLMEHTQARP